MHMHGSRDGTEWMLDSGLFSGNWVETGLSEGRRGVAAARILYSVFCILPAAYARDAYSRERRAEVCGPPGFCILYSVFCRPHMHVMHIHVSGGRSRDGT